MEAPISRSEAQAFGKRCGQSLLTVVREEYGLRAVREHYYDSSAKYTLSPLPLWYIGLVFIVSLPVSIYGTLTGQTTLPASNPFGMVMLVTMVGGLIAVAAAHIALWTHGKYVNLREYLN